MNINENYWTLNTLVKCIQLIGTVGGLVIEFLIFCFKSGQKVKVLSNQTQLIPCLENCGRPYQPCDLSSWGKTYFWYRLASGCLKMGRISLWKLCLLLTRTRSLPSISTSHLSLYDPPHWSLNKKTQTKNPYFFSSLLLRMESAFTHLYDFTLSCLSFSNNKEGIPYISFLNFSMQVAQYYMQILHNIFISSP